MDLVRPVSKSEGLFASGGLFCHTAPMDLPGLPTPAQAAAFWRGIARFCFASWME
jgi:hypothetical protein